jgi:ATP-dependent phosphoenolpyruvate carboxykinase
VITQYAWHSLFARQLFIRPERGELNGHEPQFQILFAPEFQADPAEDGTNSETCIVLSFKKRMVLICGTSYAGEMKKSAFPILNYLLLESSVFPMHCSANQGPSGDVALFFGLSGTGKTTLSADPQRRLIGDDEHTADAFGVLPPICRVAPAQAMFHFLSGYTAKVAGTERGLGKEPQATFSACFGAPFLPRPAAAYAALLGKKLRKHNAACWLVNTGWVGGLFGVGNRMKLAHARAILNAALSGELNSVPTIPHPVFQVAVPQSCPGVPANVLDARGLWADKTAYDRAAKELAARFNKNFEKFSGVSQEIREAAPKV